MTRICIYPRVTGMGGVGSFQQKFSAGLRARGIEISDDPADPHLDLILILAGTRHLGKIRRAKARGVPIIQRLDGINWIQRKRWAGVRYTLRAEYGNANLAFIRRYLADGVVYQSEFTRRWWEEWYGKTRVPAVVVHNGVDLAQYSPAAEENPAAPPYRILVVEGSLVGGLDLGLDWAVSLSEALTRWRESELWVVGKVAKRKQAEIHARARAKVHFHGVVPRSAIPALERQAHLFFSAEINPPCPNAVIEALACGLPVLGFDSGALRELVPPSAGSIVPYGGDPWRLDTPDLPALAAAAQEILDEQARFRAGARAHAESALGLAQMTARYLDFFVRWGLKA